MRIAVFILIAVTGLWGCVNRSSPDASTLPKTENQVLGQDVTDVETPDPVAGAHNSRNSLDYTGTYKGTLPCADCEGIETELTLGGDGAYEMATRYIGGKSTGETYRDSGSYRWEDDGNRIYLLRDGEPWLRYQVGENVLFCLDREGNRIETDLADHYKLEKVS